ncbi:MAG: RluA family pseudouridine synthase [Gammaproteobacteria bacterium]|jgi:23S rRNA pseudouridine955/2504/2580 synthase|nr:RluA family pseudouridine synthase [Gammaproteobacteria bacterium]
MKDSKQGRGVRYVTVGGDRAGQRLDNFLMYELGQVPRGLVYRLVRTGQVRVNGGRAKPMKKLKAGDEIRIPPVAGKPPETRRLPEGMVERIRACIIETNDEFFVVDKPSGVAVQGGSGLSWGLMDVLSRIDEACRPVHRIDRATSGLLVVARTHRAARELQKAFSSQTVEKRYLALLQGRLAEDRITVDAPLKKIRDASGQHRVIAADDGQAAVTHFHVLERVGGYSYVEASIETGRTHQIRAHAASIDHPLAGDERYNQHPAPAGLKRLFLHAHYLKLPWPSEQVYSAPLPEELSSVLDRIRSSHPASA